MISLIIVDYNSIEKTVAYLDEFLTMVNSNEKMNIIIVNNSCNSKALRYMRSLNIKEEIITDIDCEKASAIYKYDYKNYDLILVNSIENLGYARGNNLGSYISDRLFNKVKYYIFSNNDLKFTNELNLNDILEIFKQNESVAVVGPRIIGLDGRDQSPIKKVGIWKRGILYYPNMLLGGIFSKYIKNLDYDNKSKKCYWVSGSFIIVDREKFIMSNRFDENTFLYCEEMIFSERLLRNNYIMYFYNEFKLIHEHGKTVKSTFNTIKMEEINFISNQYYYKEYIKANKFELYLSKVSFKLYILLLPLKMWIKKIIKRG